MSALAGYLVIKARFMSTQSREWSCESYALQMGADLKGKGGLCS